MELVHDYGFAIGDDLMTPSQAFNPTSTNSKHNRINTINDFEAAARCQVHTDGSAEGESSAVLAEIAKLTADGELQVPVAALYDLKDVRQAYTHLAKGRTGGKIVLRIADPS